MDGVVGHVACRIVGVAAGRDLVVGRVDRRIEIIARLQGRLRNAIAVAIVTVSVSCAGPDGFQRGPSPAPVSMCASARNR